MISSLESKHCSRCDDQVLVLRESPNHAFHLFLTVITVGLWGAIWFLQTQRPGPWRCSHCGTVLD